MNKFISVPLLLSLTACDNAGTSDFDLVCSYFSMLEKRMTVDTVTTGNKFNFINDLVDKNLTQESSARQAWRAVVSYEPATGRYELYKEAAEASLKSSWSCEPMERLYKQI